MQQQQISAREQDQIVKESFPASDAPSWAMGSERTAQERAQRDQQEDTFGDTALTAEPKWDLAGKRVAILATDGFEQSELEEPKRALEEAGAEASVISLERGAIKGWSGKDWGGSVEVDEVIGTASAEDFDALVLPGGVMNPDTLRKDAGAVQFVRDFFEQKKPIASICHGPWMLVEAGVVDGAKLTSWPSLQTDIRNAGGEWVDEEVVADQGLITSRKPDDLAAFNSKLLETLSGGGEPRIKIGPTNV